MSEEQAVESVDDPVTVPSLTTDLRELGLEAGDTVLVHSSLSALGWVCGGPPAVVDALQEVVTETGTVAMPTHSGDYSDPADWSNPPVPDEWEVTIRETMPPYRPAVTPTRVGAVPECFRTYPETHRSDHPTVSFTAWGAEAETVVADHELDSRLGEGSPLARLYELDADVLFLGVGHDTNTSLHLAENRADIPIETVTGGAPILVDGDRKWVEFENIEEDTDDFADLGAAFEREIGLTEGQVGAGTAKLMDQRALVDFAVEWLEANR
ncbi:AAC(3) family N-acetyltransferase [Halobacteria archaeon AArc-m2/3/4]|uniref:AAC(3) family N-acetyltransferase n=1 Tax=Natronoglomus mannanivorans TaxID=2979990 RepID=A0ABT2QET2_9EURY|nr:AAC(3) family N-acetyltransferase [Halobacteria archaeon AArc-m2/3/4]